MDELWAYVTAVLDDGEILVEVAEVADENDGDFEEIERVRAAGTFEPGDFVHVVISGRDDEGTLMGTVAFAQQYDDEDRDDLRS